MNRLALAVLALAVASIARAQDTGSAVPHRCDQAWMNEALKKIVAKVQVPDPSGYIKLAPVGNAVKPVITDDAAKRELLCQAAIWKYVQGNAKLKAEFDKGELQRQINVLKIADLVFQALDQKAAAAFGAADKVYDAAKKLGVAEVEAKTISDQVGEAQGARKRANDVLSAPNVTLKEPKGKAADGAKELQASLVVPSADGPDAGPLVQAFNKAVADWMGEAAKRTSSGELAKRVLGQTWTGKDLDITFPFPTVTSKDHESLKTIQRTFDKMVDAKATVAGAKYKEAGDQPGALLSKVDVAQRSALGVAIANIQNIVKLAAAVKTDAAPAGTSQDQAGGNGVITAGVGPNVESQLKQVALQNIGASEFFDGNTAKPPTDPGANASATDKLKYQDAQARFEQAQKIMAGKVVELKDGSKQFQMPGAPPVDLGADPNADQVNAAARKVSDLILEGKPGDARRVAAEAAFVEGGAPVNLTAGGAAGPGAATGLKSGCGDGKTMKDYQKELEKERKGKSADRSKDRQSALKDYQEDLKDAQTEFKKCAYYPAAKGEKPIRKDAAVVGECQKTLTAAQNKARGSYESAIAKLGTAEEQAEEDAKITAGAESDTQKAVRKQILNRVSAAQKSWTGTGRAGFLRGKPYTYLASDGQKQFLKDHPRLVAGFFADQWPRAADEKPEDEPKNATTKANLNQCVEKGVRIGNDDDVDDRCLGPMFKTWFSDKLASAQNADDPDTALVDPKVEARRVECAKLKKDGKTLPADCADLVK